MKNRTGIFMHINTPPPNLLNFKNNATKQKKTEKGISKHKKWFFGVRFVLYATA